MAEDSTNPHVTDEDPEKCMGKLIKDPWTDENQTDWKTEDVVAEEDGVEVEIIDSEEDGVEVEWDE